MASKQLNIPFLYDELLELQAGDRVELTGTVYTARDAAHKRLFDTLQSGGKPPIDLTNQVIYYVGPTPAKPGQIIGSAGPTTSERMDHYTPILIELGLKGMIGKGKRNQQVIDSLIEHQAVYFAAVGGAAALIAKTVTSVEIVAYHDLGPEAIHRLEVIKFPVIVINDVYGGDLYKEGQSPFIVK